MQDQTCGGIKDPSKVCPPDLTDVNAQKACERIREFERMHPDVTEQIKALKSFVFPWGLGSKSESMQKIMNELEVKMSSTSMADQVSKCQNLTSQTQSNKIVGMRPSCLNVLKDVLPPADIKELLQIKDIKQENDASATNVCMINLALDTLTKMDASIENSVLQNAFNSAKGLGSDSESNQDTCNSVSVDMSACKYISQQQCCTNQINQSQSNLLDAKCSGFNRIMQKNAADTHNSCNMTAQASMTDDMHADIKNTLSQSATNKSEGLTMDFFIIFIIIFLVIVFGPVALTMFTGAKIIQYIGPILLIIGLIFMGLWLVSIKKEQKFANKPFSVCKDTTSLEPMSRSRFGDVKSRVTQDDVIGYDFFIDLADNEKGSDVDPLSIPDDKLGSVYYITQVSSAPVCTTDPNADKMAIISYKKGSQNLKFLVIGISLIIAGLGMIIYSIFSGDKTKKLPIKKPLIKTPIKTPIKPSLQKSVNKIKPSPKTPPLPESIKK
jgi:hypothetical protein